MVHCNTVAAHSNSVDTTENCITGRSFGDNNEVRILIDWRDECRNDADSVTTIQTYATTPGH